MDQGAASLLERIKALPQSDQLTILQALIRSLCECGADKGCHCWNDD